MSITRGLFTPYYYGPIGFIHIFNTHVLPRAPAHTRRSYNMIRLCTDARANTHAHIQHLSIPFQITTFGKEYEAVDTMTTYLFHDNSGGFIDDIC